MTTEDLPFLLLRASSRLVDGIQVGMAKRGFDDVRPAHGFVFALLAERGATAGQIADHLGVTKQAAAQMVNELEEKGYVDRARHPTDRRAKVVVLTRRGRACTRAAEASAAETLAPWLKTIGRREGAVVARALGTLAADGPLRPAW